MLGFTHQSRNAKTNFQYNQPGFQTMFITNKLPRQVSPRRNQKLIKKVTQRNKPLNNNFLSNQPKQQSKSKQSVTKLNQWTTGGAIRGAFDKGLQRNQLAAEQRRLRAQMKKQKQLIHQQIIVNEKQIGSKSLKMMKQKDQQIEYLQRMIDKQKQQKAKIDKVYEQKKQEIQRERHQLMELQRRIQRQGLKQKRVVQQIRKIDSRQKDVGQYNARAAKNFVRSQNPEYLRQGVTSPQQSQQYLGSNQPTQSQTLHNKNTFRQQQLDMLMNQRQRTLQGNPNLQYSPTLIPLLSKASYKIISTHVSQIVQLLIDDLLEEQVYVLEEIQLEEQRQRQISKEKSMLNDYYNVVTGLLQENDEIQNKVGKYSTMNFADLYTPKHYPCQSKRSPFHYDNPLLPIVRKISLQHQFDQQTTQELFNKKQRFIRFVSNFDEYKQSNVDMFNRCTEEIIDQAIERLAKELDKGSGEFVDIVFRNQFN